MSAHIVQLPEKYLRELEGMTLEQIAVEAAKYRSDSKNRPGTATRSILHWVRTCRCFSPASLYSFYKLYRQEWEAEKAARRLGLSERPDDRPVKGSKTAAMRRTAVFAMR